MPLTATLPVFGIEMYWFTPLKLNAEPNLPEAVVVAPLTKLPGLGPV